jgi:myo-inositol-1(or 4)-monophosphatase
VQIDASLDDYALAAALVTEAGRLALRMRAEGLTGTQKTSVSDVVTAADHAAEEFIVQRLRELRPDDAIVGEEGANFPGTSGRAWVIDPVDGTYNFLSGSTYWCSALALKNDAGAPVPGDPEVLLGAIYQPQEDRLWQGGQDRAATLNGQALPGITSAPLGQISAATYLHPTWLARPETAMPFTAAATQAATIRMLGSASCDLGGVASGRLGCWFQHSCPEWDWLPGKAIVRAAGGATRVVEVNGIRWHIAGGTQAVEEVAAALGEGAAA